MLVLLCLNRPRMEIGGGVNQSLDVGCRKWNTGNAPPLHGREKVTQGNAGMRPERHIRSGMDGGFKVSVRRTPH